ncbi:MAG: ATP synthase F1 subunit gamma [Spirochaetia bacterium]|nr:ATP synthase F1 subunit gamma [Spirochaetia bacterium]
MAGAKEIRKRITSVRNTRKITRTMEMVSTAKSKRMVDRVNEAKPYGMKIAEIIESLEGLKDSVDSPFMRNEENPKKVLLLVVTANRGLCGGYNTNILKMARSRILQLKENNAEPVLYVIGKKGMSFFKFIDHPVEASFDTIDDAFKYEDAMEIAYRIMNSFANEEVDRVEVISTVYVSSSKQEATLTPILPIGAQETEKSDSVIKSGVATASYLYEPNPQKILENLLPHMIKTIVFRLILEAVASEQIYRRIAMKAATDAAGEMIKILTRKYNRLRQASITQEISEIVAGADSVS